MHKILIVEDSSESFELARRALGSMAHIEWAKNMTDATRIVAKKTFDLILLDVTLPDGDGFGFCSILQARDESRNTPIMFLTARTSVADKVLGFSVGADDFITKPFDPMELKARVDGELRRRARKKTQAQVLRLGDLEIDKDAQKVSVFTTGQSRKVDLTTIEFKILLLLAGQQNRVFTRDEVLSTVWGENVHVFSRSVDTHVSKLRKKLGDKSHYIESVHGTGYRFSLPEQDARASQVPRLESHESALQPPPSATPLVSGTYGAALSI